MSLSEEEEEDSFMTDSESDDDDFEMDIPSEEIEQILSGGFQTPKGIANVYGTCFIDSVINSILNSSALVALYNSYLGSSITLEKVNDAFTQGMIDKEILSSLITKNCVFDYFNATYMLLLSIITKYHKNLTDEVMLYIRLYIMYLENYEEFTKKCKKCKQISDLEPTFKDCLVIHDFNFVQYFLYCTKHVTNSKCTGVNKDLLLYHFGIEMYNFSTNTKYIQHKLDASNEIDIYARCLYRITNAESKRKIIYDAILTKESDKYVLSDIVLDQYNESSVTPIHAMYYDIINHKLQNGMEVADAQIPDLIKLGYYPAILHYQLRKELSTEAIPSLIFQKKNDHDH